MGEVLVTAVAIRNVKVNPKIPKLQVVIPMIEPPVKEICKASCRLFFAAAVVCNLQSLKCSFL